MKKTANTENAAVVMPRPVGMCKPEKETLSVTDGDFSLSLVLPWAFQDGTYFECRKRFKLIAQFGTEADKRLMDSWLAYEMNLCAVTYWLTNDEKTKRAEMRDYDKLSKRRALWELLTPELDRTAAEPTATETETESEAADAPETENKEESEMKKFEVGACYWDTSAADHECVMVVKITRRTDRNVWFVRMRNGEPESEPSRTKIFTDADAEYIIPYKYSMAPVWRANRKVETESAAVETQPAAQPAVETEAHDEPEAETKTERAAKPEGRKNMNAHFDFFARCETEDAARKRYYQLSKVYHPDTGIGDTETMAIITDQYQAFMGRSSVASDIPELPAGVIALPEHCETPAAVDEAAEYADAIATVLKLHIPGIEAEINGKWVWLSGLTPEMKDAHAALKAAGYRFSGGKKMWYWVPSSERGQKKRYRGTASMGYIRTKYGSRKLDLDGLSA